jgi:hypothetical protein
VILRDTNIRRALAVRQRGFIINPFFVAPAGPANTIYNDLVSWWTLDENAASPTYADSHGANDLTQRNAGGSVNTSVNSTASGGINGSRRWNAANTDNLACYIPRSNTALDMTADTTFSFGGWFHAAFGAFGTASTIMGRSGQNFNKAKAYLFIDPTNHYTFFYSTDGAGTGVTVATTTVANADKCLVIGTYNVEANTVEIRIHTTGGGSFEKVTAARSGAIHNGSNDANFYIGEAIENDGTFNAFNRNGINKADECFFINKAITDAEFTYLFNSQNGKTYAQLVADQ